MTGEQLASDSFEEEGSGIALKTDILSEDLNTATVALQQEVKKERDALKEENAILKEKFSISQASE